MRQSLRPQSPVAPRVRRVTVPPPIGGWNKRDPLDSMAPQDATELVNWFPRTNDVVVRKGFTEHCDTGETTAIETLVNHVCPAGESLLAAVAGKIYDVSTSTPVSKLTGQTENMWQTATFGNRTFFVNGADAPQTWDQSTATFSASGFTGSGLTASDLIDVMAFKQRLYFIEHNTRSIWYGGLNAVTGSLTEFDLSTVGNFGGTLLALGQITNDGGDGVDDLFVVFTTTGEVIIYQGSDPGASNWALVGIFHIGAPISRRGVAQFGSDLVAITEDGFVALTEVLPFGRTGLAPTLSDKISGAATDAARQYGANEGWKVLMYPKNNMLIFNVPRSETAFDQYVMNTRTKAWCKFTKMNGKDWSLFQRDLYFAGQDGKVYQADTGTTDNGSTIVADGRCAWNYLGDRGSIKRLSLARPNFVAQFTPPLAIGMAMDFNPNVDFSSVNFSLPADLGIWDESTWDGAIWGFAFSTAADWLSVSGEGYNVSIRIRVSSEDSSPQWNSTNLVYEPGINY